MAGIVVKHKETGVTYAISEDRFNAKVHKKLRDLEPGESVLAFRPKPERALGEATDAKTTKTEEPAAGSKDAK